MTFDILEKFDTVDTSELTIINGGLDAARCIIGWTFSRLFGICIIELGEAIIAFCEGTGSSFYGIES